MSNIRLLFTLVITSLVFTSCKKLSEADIPLREECMESDFYDSFVAKSEKIISKKDSTGIYLMQIRDTANCICHVKYDLDDSSEVVAVFQQNDWLYIEPLQDSLELGADSLETDSTTKEVSVDSFYIDESEIHGGEQWNEYNPEQEEVNDSIPTDSIDAQESPVINDTTENNQ